METATKTPTLRLPGRVAPEKWRTYR
jgi:hypothetical protein